VITDHDGIARADAPSPVAAMRTTTC
jgi:hypothetical protein